MGKEVKTEDAEQGRKSKGGKKDTITQTQNPKLLKNAVKQNIYIFQNNAGLKFIFLPIFKNNEPKRNLRPLSGPAVSSKPWLQLVINKAVFVVKDTGILCTGEQSDT